MTTPKYIQIHNNIKQFIEQNQWKVGQKIPSERELANNFEVSRMTCRQAIRTLVQEGILKQVAGAGTYVASQKLQEKMTGVMSFTDIMLAQGKNPSSNTISYHEVEPSLTEREKLHLTSNERVLRMERIRYGDNIPICLEIVTIPAKIVKGLNKKDITNSFYNALENKKNLVPTKSEQTLSAMLASENVADYLQVKRGDPILQLHQLTYLKDNTPVEYVRTQYVGERFEFYLSK